MDATAWARVLALAGIEVRATAADAGGGGGKTAHEPAGSPKGGQFTSRPGSGAKATHNRPKKAAAPQNVPQAPATPRRVKEGDSGEDVRYAQYAMSLLGFQVAQDGRFGPETAAAVKQIQQRLGVKHPNGHITPALLHKMQDAVRLSPCVGGQRNLAFEALWEQRDDGLEDGDLDFDETAEAILDALDEVERSAGDDWDERGGHDVSKELRIPSGKGGGRWTKSPITAAIAHALEEWAKGDGPDDPFVFDGKPIDREPLRKAAVARGITLKRGASREDIVAALKGDLKVKVRDAKAAKSPDAGKPVRFTLTGGGMSAEEKRLRAEMGDVDFERRMAGDRAWIKYLDHGPDSMSATELKALADRWNVSTKDLGVASHGTGKPLSKASLIKALDLAHSRGRVGPRPDLLVPDSKAGDSKLRNLDVGVFTEPNGKVSLWEVSDSGERRRRVALADDLAGLEKWASDNGESELADWARKERGGKAPKAPDVPAKVTPAAKKAAPGAPSTGLDKTNAPTPDELTTIGELHAKANLANGWVREDALSPGSRTHVDDLVAKGWLQKHTTADGVMYRIDPRPAGARKATDSGALVGEVLPPLSTGGGRISLDKVNRGAILQGYRTDAGGFENVPEDGSADQSRVMRVIVQRIEHVDDNGEPTRALLASKSRIIGHDADTGQRVESGVVPRGSYWAWHMNPEGDTSPDIEGQALNVTDVPHSGTSLPSGKAPKAAKKAAGSVRERTKADMAVAGWTVENTPSIGTAEYHGVSLMDHIRTLDREPARDQLDLLKVGSVDEPNTLKGLLKSQKLPVSGRKRELVDRLVEHTHGGGTPATPATPSPSPSAPHRTGRYELPAGVTQTDADALKKALARRQDVSGMPGGNDAALVERLDLENNATRLLRNFQAENRAIGFMTEPQAQQELARRAKAAFANRQVAVNIGPTALEQILRDGRFKTQLETDTSSGVFQPEERRFRESVWFGLPEDVDPAERPIYGYLMTRGNGKKLTDVYGDVRVVLKPEVRSRTSASVGDSMENIIASRPAPVDDPDWYAFNVNLDRDVLDKVDRNYDGPAFNKATYLEAQVHGGVTTNDIAEIVLGSEPTPQLREALKASGLKWRVSRRSS